MITKARSVGIYVTDQDRARNFYADILGFEVLREEPMGEEMPSRARWIEVAPPGAQTTFFLFTPPGLESRIGGFSNIVFECDDVRDTHRTLAERGVEFTQVPHERPWGWWAQFRDPDGNEFGLGEGQD